MNLSVLLASWNINDFIFTEAEGGIENRTVIITTPEKKAVLRIYRQDNKTPEEVTAEIDFVRFLSSQTPLVPALFPTNNGTLLAETIVGGVLWRSILMEFKPGIIQNSTQKKIVNKWATRWRIFI